MLPKFVISKALAGREAVVQAMNRCFAADSHKEGSFWVKAPYEALNGKIDSMDIAPFGCVSGIDLCRLKDALIIFSTLQEAPRHRATGTGARMVMADMYTGPQEGFSHYHC